MLYLLPYLFICGTDFIGFIAGTKKDLIPVRLTPDGEVLDPGRGPDSEAVKDRQALLDERQRKASQYRSAADKARNHALYSLTRKLKLETKTPYRMHLRMFVLIHSYYCSWWHRGRGTPRAASGYRSKSRSRSVKIYSLFSNVLEINKYAFQNHRLVHEKG